MNEGLKAHQHIRLFSAIKFVFFRKSGYLPLLKNNGKACERRKSGRERAEGSFRCMVSIDRNTHPHIFIRRAGCHTGVGFLGRCQLLLHTVGVTLAGGLSLQARPISCHKVRQDLGSPQCTTTSMLCQCGYSLQSVPRP